MSASLQRLLTVIGYPDGEMPSGGDSLSLKVDGRIVKAVERAGRIVLSCTLGEVDDAGLRRLAGYAAGRVLKEGATLAWDPSEAALMLWQEVSAAASDDVLRRFFEVFAASCDWWCDRVGELHSDERVPELMIRP